MAGSLRRDGRFGKALAKVMGRSGLSTGEVAKKLAVRRTTVQAWLTGSEPSEPNFRKLCVLFPELEKFA